MRRQVRDARRGASAGAGLEAGEEDQPAVLDAAEVDGLAAGEAELADDRQGEGGRATVVREGRSGEEGRASDAPAERAPLEDGEAAALQRH